MRKGWIKVKVVYGGRAKEFDFNIDFKVLRVVEEVYRAFGLPPPPVNYQLFSVEGGGPEVLDFHKTLREQGVKNGSKLVLVHVHVVGLSCARKQY